MEIIIALVWFGISVVVGIVAIDRKIGFFGAFIASLLLSPIIGILLSLMTPHEVETEILAELKKLNAQKAADEAA